MYIWLGGRVNRTQFPSGVNNHDYEYSLTPALDLSDVTDLTITEGEGQGDDTIQFTLRTSRPNEAQSFEIVVVEDRGEILGVYDIIDRQASLNQVVIEGRVDNFFAVTTRQLVSRLEDFAAFLSLPNRFYSGLLRNAEDANQEPYATWARMYERVRELSGDTDEEQQLSWTRAVGQLSIENTLPDLDAALRDWGMTIKPFVRILNARGSTIRIRRELLLQTLYPLGITQARALRQVASVRDGVLTAVGTQVARLEDLDVTTFEDYSADLTDAFNIPNAFRNRNIAVEVRVGAEQQQTVIQFPDPVSPDQSQGTYEPPPLFLDRGVLQDRHAVITMDVARWELQQNVYTATLNFHQEETPYHVRQIIRVPEATLPFGGRYIQSGFTVANRASRYWRIVNVTRSYKGESRTTTLQLAQWQGAYERPPRVQSATDQFVRTGLEPVLPLQVMALYLDGQPIASLQGSQLDISGTRSLQLRMDEDNLRDSDVVVVGTISQVITDPSGTLTDAEKIEGFRYSPTLPITFRVPSGQIESNSVNVNVLSRNIRYNARYPINLVIALGTPQTDSGEIAAGPISTAPLTVR